MKNCIYENQRQLCGAETVGIFPECTSLAVAYIPFQQWSDDCLYSPDVALTKGTLFKTLDLPWKGGCC